MARPADALRLAWFELVNACHALPAGPPKYSLVARVKEVPESVGGSAWLLPEGVAPQTGRLMIGVGLRFRRNRCCDRTCASALTIRGIRSIWSSLTGKSTSRTGICCLAEAKGRWSGIAANDRACECPGCDKAHEVDSVRHFLLVCSHWPAERELLLMSNVLLSDISLSMKARLGSIDANHDMWLRLMLSGPLHEMGVDYTEAIAALLKRISSRMWDRYMTCPTCCTCRISLCIAHARRCGTARRCTGSLVAT